MLIYCWLTDWFIFLLHASPVVDNADINQTRLFMGPPCGTVWCLLCHGNSLSVNTFKRKLKSCLFRQCQCRTTSGAAVTFSVILMTSTNILSSSLSVYATVPRSTTPWVRQNYPSVLHPGQLDFRDQCKCRRQDFVASSSSSSRLIIHRSIKHDERATV